MPQAKKPRRNDIERRIHFYRADCGTDDAGKRIAFEPAKALEYIGDLPFDLNEGAESRYHTEDTNTYCCWVESLRLVQFAVIRRDALPTIEEKGNRTPLSLSDAAGVADVIHVRLFDDNIVGFDFNQYGPRISRFGRYLSAVAGGRCHEVVFEPLLRGDLAAELQDGKELRVFALRIRRSEVETIEQVDASLASAFRTIMGITDAPELEVVVRPKPYSGNSIGTRLLAITRNLVRRDDLRDIASLFQVRVGQPGRAGEDLDLLRDHFIVDKRIVRQSETSRELNSEDAFAKIGEAYEERREELRAAASLVAQ
jgi:hypothetical protein